jgi:Flp pilus assembly protein TadG
MQRVTPELSRTRSLDRVSRDRGAVAVIMALLMVPLIGFAAVAVDVAALRAQQQQLQTGADAGALAIAQDCARNNCGTPTTTAQSLAQANTNDGSAASVVSPVSTASRTVTVTTTSVRTHHFAQVLGFKTGSVAAKATVIWGTPGRGTAVIPLTFSWCEFKLQTGGGLPSDTIERTILFTKGSATSCTGPSNNVVPGGFGWLDVSSGCNLTTIIGQMLKSSTGASLPSGCSTADMVAQQNKTVLLPIFDQAFDQGNSATYRVYGYAAFVLTGYHFPSYSWNAGGCTSPNVNCIKGYFTKFVDQSSAFDISATAPDMGARSILLTN